MPTLFSSHDDELNILFSHHKNTLQNLQKLYHNTPECFTIFMAGSPGASAAVHIKQLGLFGMIIRLPESILHRIAKSKLYSEPDESSSWFVQIRQLCSKYNLPSALFLLEHTPNKSSFKSLVTRKVIDFWQTKLRDVAASKRSLFYFKLQYLSLPKIPTLSGPPELTALLKSKNL